MAIDDYDIVLPPDYGDFLCIDCARVGAVDHPHWDDPEDEDGNMRPVFDLDEIPELMVCGKCGYISTLGSFGPEAVDRGLDMLREYLRHGEGNAEYLDIYADRLTHCYLGARWEAKRGELILDKYHLLRRKLMANNKDTVETLAAALHDAFTDGGHWTGWDDLVLQPDTVPEFLNLLRALPLRRWTEWAMVLGVAAPTYDQVDAVIASLADSLEPIADIPVVAISVEDRP